MQGNTEDQNVRVMPELPTEQSKAFPRGAIIVVGLFLAGALGYFLFSYSSWSEFGEEANRARIASYTPTALLESQFLGDYQAAKLAYNEIMSKPLLDPDEKAIANMAAVRLDFNLSGGDVEGILSDIRMHKQIILDQDVDPWLRVRALNALATSYCTSGRDPLAFQEIYKDAPFNQYLAPGDPDLSARNLAEWSYNTHPTAYAAIRMARWYSQWAADVKDLTDETRLQYRAEADKYLKASDPLLADELDGNPLFAKSTEYASYKFWRARVVGWLATSRSEQYAQYKAQYKKEYDDMIDFVKNGSAVTRDNLYFGRQYYAVTALRIDDDVATAKAQLDELAREINAEPNPLAIVYVRFLRNEYKNRPNGPVILGVRALMRVSPDFAAMVTRVRDLPEPTALSAAEGTETLSFADKSFLNDF